MSGEGSSRGKSYFRGRGKPFWIKRKRKENQGASEGEDSGQQNIRTFLRDDSSQNVNPYKAWDSYFPDERYKRRCDIVRKVEASSSFFGSFLAPRAIEGMEEKRSLTLEMKEFEESKEFSAGWPTFSEDLLHDPHAALASLSLGLHKVVNDKVELEQNEQFPEVYVRVVNIGASVPIRNLKAGLFGKLVTVRGTVIRVGSCKLECTMLGFACVNCGSAWSEPQPNGSYREPTSCKGNTPACRSKTFLQLLSSSSRLTKSRNCQTIKLQEYTANDMEREGGRVPRTLEVDFCDDLVDLSAPGDSVTVTGIVRVRNKEEIVQGGGGRKGGKPGSNLYTVYLEGVSLVNIKGKSARNQGNIGVEFSLKDYYAIQEIHEEPQLFKLLVNSISPGVYGHEMVKAGLLLALAGGSADSQTRGMPHILIVGDPGLGKTHLLHSCASLAPRGVYVCGNTASSSGLTVTLVKEAGGDFGLEAGALVLANHGICCIDEFDKMSSQHMALLEAMEQQRVSVAKGGLVCSLPAHTTILAAANPTGGHFIRGKSLLENIKMGLPLVSRFDLVFVLLDRPDEELDSLLSEHVMALHSGRRHKEFHNVSSLQTGSISDLDSPLPVRLKVFPGEELEFIPELLMRKYIAYVRKYVPNPRLSPGAVAILQEFYLELRRCHRAPSSTPITTRQLEALIRLTQARAKVELREEAGESDAGEVVELMKWSMGGLYTAENSVGRMHANTKNPGAPTATKAKKFIAGLQRRAELEGRTIFTKAEMKELCETLNIKVDDFFGFVSMLNDRGFLLSKGGNKYQLLSTS